MSRFVLSLVTLTMLIACKLSALPPFPAEVKKVVTFIYVSDKYLSGKSDNLIPNGTGFFVGVKNPKNPSYSSVYLVTAKHVLQDTTKAFFPKVAIRLNKRVGGVETIEIPLILKGKDRDVFLHNDKSVELAVIPALPNPVIYDFQIMPEDFITSKAAFDSLKIQEGAEVFFTGLFLPYQGVLRNYPIVRFGRVALLTNEKIQWSDQKMDLYLIETSSFGGNSGSPVFFYFEPVGPPGTTIIGATPIFKLAGVILGFFGQPQPIQVVETSKIPFSVSNIGISAVVPSYKLHDILFGNELKKLRKF